METSIEQRHLAAPRATGGPRPQRWERGYASALGAPHAAKPYPRRGRTPPSTELDPFARTLRLRLRVAVGRSGVPEPLRDRRVREAVNFEDLGP